jgi:hypothetical protein
VLVAGLEICFRGLLAIIEGAMRFREIPKNPGLVRIQNRQLTVYLSGVRPTA